jgi:starch phosphorylase
VLDGWWAEAWDGENGWAITPHPEFDQETREQLEAEELLNILEYQVIPTYYGRNEDGEPEDWIRTSKASMKSVLPRFNTIRMAMDYLRDAYGPAAREGRLLEADGAAAELAAWKHRIAGAWPGVSARLAQPMPKAIQAGGHVTLEVAVELNGIGSEDVFVECVLSDNALVRDHEVCSVPLFLAGESGSGEALYCCDLFDNDESCSVGGLQHFRIRVYPCHPLLSHPLECGLMIWL